LILSILQGDDRTVGSQQSPGGIQANLQKIRPYNVPSQHTLQLPPNKLPVKSCVNICSIKKGNNSRNMIFSQDFHARSLLKDMLKAKKSPSS